MRKIKVAATAAILTTSTLVMAASQGMSPHSSVLEQCASALTTMDIQARLWMANEIPAHRISVTTNGRVVTLAGEVSSKTAQDKAIRIATLARDVDRVIDNLQVTSL
ncbi:hypothetical protein WH50_23470 [Pokkaliibacter plantistimulans]|uniref:BON domain-containing protein n=2 Tax=Pseudomonadota TaxID=1224 RepID=A0ABX5LRF3_9GAMM|nr:BON domain-containing protein [Pokkaliibacter plantistimulans]PPC77116.1 hypothetical protein C4K68_11925 [Pokkaliibacter plantistimulans]PXF28951.1 hypothetical protein WH50_23470 [Pokkaliibacter plantistimulans]